MAGRGRKTTDEQKIKQIIAISPKGLELLQEWARLRGTNRSEVVERLARGELGRPSEAEFLDEELELMQQALTLQFAFLEDELGGRGVFEDKPLEPRDVAALKQQIKVVHSAMKKLKEKLGDGISS